MQLDMHYYGTYAMARTAGLRNGVAQAIATAAQFVDDSITVSTELSDGAYLHHDATAHHPSELKPNIDPDDQRRVWVPFHFLPGNDGETLAEKLICRKDSAIAREMVEHALSLAKEPYGHVLMGITAHVYADTFSHYGFSGITSSLNLVDAESITPKIQDAEILAYVTGKFQAFVEKRAAGAANLLGLGHGGVATYPDRPYLTWNFTYSDGRESGERRNQDTFFEACQRLHDMFTRYAELVPSYTDASARREFSAIGESVATILAQEGKLEDRSDAWQKAFQSGQLLGQGRSESIPDYAPALFADDAMALQQNSTAEAEKSLTYQFMQAANIHRQFVLRQLLPSHGLQVMVP